MILYITRKFPPMTGGMERVSYELYRHLAKVTDVKLIKWDGSNKWLFLVLPHFLMRSCLVLLTSRVKAIYLQDGLLSPLGVVIKYVFNKPVSITIHGLDITYTNRFYQFLIPKCIRKLDKIICVSSATKEQCLKRGIPQNKIVVIPNGISDDFYIREDVQKLNDRLCKKMKMNLRNRKIILSVGRIVERKGFHWFVTNVLPKIVMEERDVVFLLAGEGPFKGTIEKSIVDAGMRKHAILLGKVDNETLRLLYNSSHVMVVPNIPVEGDIEGFGVVVLEATSCGLPLVASGTEGIREAIVHGQNGFLVETFNAEKFSRTLLFILENSRRAKALGEKARQFTLRNFAWEKIAKMYFEILSRTAPYNCGVNLSPSGKKNTSCEGQ